ncbi:MAG TPA: fibronectin type III domain-containing protein [Actinomycetota bacterium]
MSGPIDQQPPIATRGGRLWLLIASAAVCGIVAGWLLTRAPGPPGPPSDVTGEAFRCSGSCRRLDPSITLRWSEPIDGGEPTGYRVERDGVTLAGANAETIATTTLVDRDVTFGRRYEYRVVALSAAGPSPPSPTIAVRLPRPPTTSAQLTGVYTVHLTVRDARALSSVLGIADPTPGTRAIDRWTFEPVCAPPLSACPTRWEGLDGHLVANGRAWVGTVTGPDARCGGGTKVTAPTRFDLRVIHARGDSDAWVVRSFGGSVSVSFHCPGFLISHGSVDVRGTRR